LIDREIHTGFIKARTHETISQISILEDAINDEQEIEFYYKSQRAKKAVLRRVRPIGLLFGRFAYLVAIPSSDSGHKKPQTYRMDLLDEVSAVDSFFEAERGFSFKDWSKQSYGIFHGDTEIKVKLLFSKKVADRASKITFHSSQQMKQHKNGTLTVMLRCKGHQELIHELIHPDWLGRVKIQEPPELRTEYLEYLERAKAAII
jgi:predicted DNA-binding transcriptional regulator YafY